MAVGSTAGTEGEDVEGGVGEGAGNLKLFSRSVWPVAVEGADAIGGAVAIGGVDAIGGAIAVGGTLDAIEAPSPGARGGVGNRERFGTGGGA